MLNKREETKELNNRNQMEALHQKHIDLAKGALLKHTKSLVGVKLGAIFRYLNGFYVEHPAADNARSFP